MLISCKLINVSFKDEFFNIVLRGFTLENKFFKLRRSLFLLVKF